MQRLVGVLLIGAAMACRPSAKDLAVDDNPRGFRGAENDYATRQGRALFAHYCAACHGIEGTGDGFNAYSLDPKPRDLTSAELQAQLSNEEIASAVRLGGGGIGLSTGMPPWGNTLNDREIGQLVAWIRHLGKTPATDSSAE